jgi:hypothetical protein
MIAILDLPLVAAVAVVRGATSAPIPPWIVLVVPRLDLRSTSPLVDVMNHCASVSVKADSNWWRESSSIPEPRPAWFVVDGDRDAPPAPGRAPIDTDAPHEFDAGVLPPVTTLRRTGYEAVTIVGRRAVPARDVRPYVDECLAAGMRVRCVAA